MARPLEETLSVIPQTAAIVRAMILLGTTVGVVVGQWLGSPEMKGLTRVRAGTGSGVVAAAVYLMHEWLVWWVTREGVATWWPKLLSGVLVFTMFGSWACVASMVGSLAAATGVRERRGREVEGSGKTGEREEGGS
jgi:predicted branched-subunit amino acid permease